MDVASELCPGMSIPGLEVVLESRKSLIEHDERVPSHHLEPDPRRYTSSGGDAVLRAPRAGCAGSPARGTRAGAPGLTDAKRAARKTNRRSRGLLLWVFWRVILP